MQQVLLAIHLIVVLALIGVILLQRSEGGLGLGGGGGLSGLMSSRGQANLLTRATAFLALMFFITSLTLAIVSRKGQQSDSIFNNISAPTTATSSSPIQEKPDVSSESESSAAGTEQQSSVPQVPQSQ